VSLRPLGTEPQARAVRIGRRDSEL